MEEEKLCNRIKKSEFSEYVERVFFFIYLLTFSMLHYKVILHALELNIQNKVTYIYNLAQFLLFFIVTAGLLSVF